MSNRQGRGWAYTGAILGGAVSIAANVGHSYVPPKGAAADWSPHLGAVVGAVFWPVALFVAVEIFARIAWPTGRRWTALRFLGLLPVALVAAVVSYRHLAGLLSYYREDGLTATIGPLAVDGLMVMASGALIATSRARVAVLDEDERHTVPAAGGLHTVDPIALAALATGEGRPFAHGLEVAAPEVSNDVNADVSTQVPPVAAKPAARRPARRPTAADRVAKAATRTPAATPAQLAARLGLSERTVQRHLPRPADDTTTTPQRPSGGVNGRTAEVLAVP